MFEKTNKIIRIGASELHYSIIPWDSEYLKNTTIEIEHVAVSTISTLKKLMNQLKKNHKLKKGDLLVTKIPLTEFTKIHLLYQAGFYYIEQAITLDIDLSSWNPKAFHFPNGNKYQIIPAGVSDKTAIRRIAQSTFTADRYHLDPNIPKERADYRYAKWIENSFQNKDSFYKFVDAKNTTLGFFIVNETKDYAEFRLGGLDASQKGKGLGKMMYHHMYQVLKEKKYPSITSVISLNNIQVLNVYMYLACAKFAHPLIVLHCMI